MRPYRAIRACLRCWANTWLAPITALTMLFSDASVLSGIAATPDAGGKLDPTKQKSRGSGPRKERRILPVWTAHWCRWYAGLRRFVAACHRCNGLIIAAVAMSRAADSVRARVGSTRQRPEACGTKLKQCTIRRSFFRLEPCLFRFVRSSLRPATLAAAMSGRIRLPAKRRRRAWEVAKDQVDCHGDQQATPFCRRRRTTMRNIPRQIVSVVAASICCLVTVLAAVLVVHAGANRWTAIGPYGANIVTLAIDPSHTLDGLRRDQGLRRSEERGRRSHLGNRQRRAADQQCLCT